MTDTSWHHIRAIVFDLDDTLYAQREFKASGFRAIATRLAAGDGHNADRILHALMQAMQRLGPSHPQLIDAALNALGLGDVDPSPLVDVFRRHRPSIVLYDGVEATLARLKMRFRLGLLTDGLASVQRSKIAGLALTDVFEHVVVSDEHQMSKPDERLYEMFERAFGLPPQQLVYVGDNPNKDFLGARQRGWHTLRVRCGEYADSIAPGAVHDADHACGSVPDIEQIVAARMQGAT